METLGRLRPIQEDEVELFRGWRNAPAVRANMFTRHEISPEEHRAWWARTRAREDQAYFMYERDRVPLGIVCFTQIDRTNRNAAWAFYAAPEAPRGTGSRMEFLALAHAFGGLKLHKLYCEVLAFNEPVIRMHQKFGFVPEGVFREQHLHENGFVDIHRLGLLKHDWEVIRESVLSRLVR